MLITSRPHQRNRKLLPFLCIPAILVLMSIACSREQQNIGESIDRLFEGNSEQNESIEVELPSPETLRLSVADSINSRDYAATLEALENLKAHPEHDYYWATYAEAFLDYNLGLYDDALELVNSLGPGPFHTDLLKLRADIYTSMHQLDNARRDLETILLSGFGGDSLVLYMLWKIARSQGDVELIRTMEGKMDEPHDLATNDMFITFERALLKRDFIAATQALDRLPNLPYTLGNPLTQFHDPGILISRAELAFEQGEVDRAIEILRKVPDGYPGVTVGFPILTQYGLSTGRYDDARNWAIEGLLQSGCADIVSDLGFLIPESPPDQGSAIGPIRHSEAAYLLVVIGHTALATGGVAEALVCAEKAMIVNPYEESAYLLRSSALEIEGDITGAIGAAVVGLRIAPFHNELALRFISLAKSAPLAVGPADPDPETVLQDVIDRARASHEAFPYDPTSACILGLALYFSGETSAEDLLLAAFDDSPHRMDFALEYATSIAESGNPTRAKKILGDFDLPADLPLLVQLYRRVKISGSDDLLEFAEWIREKMDPENKFAPVLDPLVVSF